MVALTRIRNNQVYNSDINAQYKLQPYSVTGGLLSNNFTYTGNMTIGNLVVNGVTTTIDTTNLVVADPLLAINRNQSGSPSYDLGFVMGRGNQTNVAMIWEENAQQFQLQYTTESTAATTFGTINNSGYANLQAYGIKVNNATIGTSSVTNFVASNVAISGGTIDNTTIGATTPNSGVFTSVTTASGGQLTGYHTGAIGANSANSGAFTTITATSTLVAQGTITGGGQVIGYFNGAVGANAPNTVVATSVTTSSGGQLTGYLTGAIGANTPNTAVFTTVTASGNITAQTANVYAAYITANTATYSGGYYWSNGATLASTITGLYSNSNVALYLPTYNGNIGNLATGNLIPLANTSYYLGNSTLYWANAYANNFNAITQLSTPKIQFTVGGASILEDNSLDLAIVGPYQISVKPGSYQYTFNNNGSLSGPGGTFVYSNGAVYGNITATGAYWANGVSFASTITGTYSNSNVATYLATYSGNLSAGNITVSNGGVITGYLNGAIGANGANSATFTTATITNNANSYGSGQGALQIAGGFYAGGDSYITGNLSITGNLTSVGYNELIANAPLLYLSVGSISTYNYELGFYSHKYDAIEGYNHTGLVRNHLDNSWFLFSNIRTEPTNTVDLANASIIYDTLKLGNVIAYSGNTSTSTTTGAAVIYGGMGVSGNIYAAAIQGTPIGNGLASTGAFTTITSSNNITAQTANVYASNVVGNTALYGAQYYWSNGVALASTITGTYSNSNVAAYLLTYTGNLSAGNITIVSGGQISGYFTGAIGANVANSGAFTTVTASDNITAQTANVYAAYVVANTALYSAQYYWTNGATLASTITGTYSNSNVASYLPTYTGVLTAGSVTTVSGGQHIGYLTGAIGANVANSGVFTTANVNGTLYAATINAATIGNSGATFTGASQTVTGNVNAQNFNGGNTATVGNLIANGGISSTSTGTGSLIVVGGAGVSGNLNVGANSYITSTENVPTVFSSNIYPYANSGNINLYTASNSNLTINANQLVANLVVHGNSAAGYQNLLVTNGATGQVGIKIAPNAIVSNVSLQINSTDAMIVPIGAQSQRPSNAQQGMLRYNTNNNQLEFYNGTIWTGTGSVFTIISADQFTGNGSATSFTLSQSTTTNGVIVSINGVVQIPTTAYTVSGTTLTFTEAPLSTDIIDARAITTTTTVTSISDASGANTVVANTAGVYTTALNSVSYLANSSGNFFGGGISTLSANTSLSAGVPTVIDSFSTTTYRGAKYVVTLSDYSNYNFTMAEVILVCGNSNASVQTYGVVSANGTSIGNFYANVSGTTARLYANAGVSSYAKVQQIYMPL